MLAEQGSVVRDQWVAVLLRRPAATPGAGGEGRSQQRQLSAARALGAAVLELATLGSWSDERGLTRTGHN